MYLEYKTTATWNRKEVMIDLVRSMTGVYTSISQFSASCDKTVTNFAATTVAPGWTIVDDQSALATDPFFIVSAPDAAGVTKLMKVFYSTASDYVGFHGCTSYNSTTKAIDTAICQSNFALQAIPSAVSNASAAVFRFFVTQRYVLLLRYSNALYTEVIISYELPRPAGSAYWNSANGKSTLVVGNYAQNVMTDASISVGGNGGTSTPGESKMSAMTGTNSNNCLVNYTNIISSSFFTTGNYTSLPMTFGNATGVGTYAKGATPPLTLNGFLDDSFLHSITAIGLSPLDEIVINGTPYVVGGSGSGATQTLFPKV